MTRTRRGGARPLDIAATLAALSWAVLCLLALYSWQAYPSPGSGYALWLLGVSALTIAVYGVDKGRARARGQRISERSLLALGFLGGFLGAFCAMGLWRHKTQHLSFFLLNGLALALHLGALYLLARG